MTNDKMDLMQPGPSDGRIRVVDDEGHMLFIYNYLTRCIEFIPVKTRRYDNRRVLCIVSTDELRSMGSRNVISEKPVKRLVAKVIDAES